MAQVPRGNLRWGYTKIVGEVRKLSYSSTGRATAERILKRYGLAPRPHHGALSWADFLGHYGQLIRVCDFFIVTTVALRTYYVLFLTNVSTRRIVHCNMSQHPDSDWVAQQFRNLAVMRQELPPTSATTATASTRPVPTNSCERWARSRGCCHLGHPI